MTKMTELEARYCYLVEAIGLTPVEAYKQIVKENKLKIGQCISDEEDEDND